MRTLFRVVTATVFLASCGQTDRRTETEAPKEALIADTSVRSKTLPIGIDPSKHQKLQYKEWASFWATFKKAASSKDTDGIVSLTNVPFYQNTEECDQATFTSYFMEQAFEIKKKTPEAILIDTFMLRSITGGKTSGSKIDSLRYTNANGKDFYFARIDSAYKFLAVITPG